MEKRLKLKISRMFRSSLGSCRSKNISDEMEHPFFYPQNSHHHQQLIQFFSPKPKPPPPFPSMCRPKSSQTPQTEKKHLLYPKTKLTDRSSLLPFLADKNGRYNCPPASPISPLKKTSKPKQRKSKKKRDKKSQLNKNRKFDEFFASVSGNYYYGRWDTSSEDENEGKNDDDDQTTFFSSKPLSSDSSDSFRRNRAKNRQGRIKNGEFEKGLISFEGKVKDSFAVVKRSSDPYNDFRTSMVEMIVERQLFGSEDLENLLQCFLSLNSISHHRAIIEVFIEIWETLFCEWAKYY